MWLEWMYFNVFVRAHSKFFNILLIIFGSLLATHSSSLCTVYLYCKIKSIVFYNTVLMSDYIVWIYDCKNSTFRFLWLYMHTHPTIVGYQYYRFLSSSVLPESYATSKRWLCNAIQQKSTCIDGWRIPRTDQNGSTDFVIASCRHTCSVNVEDRGEAFDCSQSGQSFKSVVARITRDLQMQRSIKFGDAYARSLSKSNAAFSKEHRTIRYLYVRSSVTPRKVTYYSATMPHETTIMT